MASEKKTTNAAIIRVHKTSKYVVMSNKHLLFEKPPLSLKGKGLLSMLLALPDDWNYSINGLVSICKESRGCIKSTLDELKKFGYLKIEKQFANQTKSKQIEYIYHIFEERNGEIIAEESKSQEGDFTPLDVLENQEVENPPLENQTLENPTQLNNKKINKEEQNNKEIISCKNENVFTPADLFNLYKNICLSFPQPRELTEERDKKAKKRISKKPGRDFWETVCKKAQESKFCKKGSFFSFDWIIKNDSNPLKVFEGNYDNDRYKTTNNNNSKTVNFNKYAKCYENSEVAHA